MEQINNNSEVLQLLIGCPYNTFPNVGRHRSRGCIIRHTHKAGHGILQKAGAGLCRPLQGGRTTCKRERKIYIYIIMYDKIYGELITNQFLGYNDIHIRGYSWDWSAGN